MKKNIRSDALYAAQGGVIAALYVILTHISNEFGLANGAIQVRLSEALTILPAFTPSAIPGLFVGCILANFSTGAALYDVIFGSLATLAAAFATRFLKDSSRFLLPLPPILANTIVVPLVLKYVYNEEHTLLFMMFTVFIGEFISCGILGTIIYPWTKKIFDRL